MSFHWIELDSQLVPVFPANVQLSHYKFLGQVTCWCLEEFLKLCGCTRETVGDQGHAGSRNSNKTVSSGCPIACPRLGRFLGSISILLDGSSFMRSSGSCSVCCWRMILISFSVDFSSRPLVLTAVPCSPFLLLLARCSCNPVQSHTISCDPRSFLSLLLEPAAAESDPRIPSQFSLRNRVVAVPIAGAINPSY